MGFRNVKNKEVRKTITRQSQTKYTVFVIILPNKVKFRIKSINQSKRTMFRAKGYATQEDITVMENVLSNNMVVTLIKYKLHKM